MQAAALFLRFCKFSRARAKFSMSWAHLEPMFCLELRASRYVIEEEEFR